MKFIFTIFLSLVTFVSGFAQTTILNGGWVVRNNGKSRIRVKSVEIKKSLIAITYEEEALKALRELVIYPFNYAQVAVGGINTWSEQCFYVNGNVYDSYYGFKYNNVSAGSVVSYQILLKRAIPSGVTDFEFSSIRKEYNFKCKLNNPRKDYLQYYSESDVKKQIDQNNDKLLGIYEPLDDSEATLACVKQNDTYYLIHLSSMSQFQFKQYWQIGDIKAALKNTASGLIKAKWTTSDKASIQSMYLAFDGVTMVAMDNNKEYTYLKTYPTEAVSESRNNNNNHDAEWSGTGFALKNGYVVTNHHVVNGATTIKIIGVNGTHDEYSASVVGVDKNNDLALLRITDSNFKGFGTLPYAITASICDVGADVFVLGYPMPTYMGEEIKLTNGIISSRSGYQGDITTYQISAPVQPGNSGGPMFDYNGNVVGVVNAGIPGAENVGYAIKISFLINLIKSVTSETIIPKTNTISSKNLSQKVSDVRQYVFFIKCK